MAKKIFFGNYKGGVGKTTSTFQIAYELYENHNASVLLLDLDPQSSLSSVCMAKCGMELDGGIETNKFFTDDKDNKQKLNFKTLNYVYELYMQARRMNSIKFKLECKDIIRSIRKSDSKTLDFIPNSLFSEYGGLDKISMKVGESVENLLILRDFIEDNDLNGNDKYDYIFFDCPPSNNIITQSAFLYCDFYIIPTIMDKLSVNGVNHYITVIDKLYSEYCINHDNADVLSLLFGSKPELIGIFETMRKTQASSIVFRNSINPKYHLFNTVILHHKDTSNYTGDGDKADDEDYEELTIEIRDRLNKLELGEDYQEISNEMHKQLAKIKDGKTIVKREIKKTSEYINLINKMRDCLKQIK